MTIWMVVIFARNRERTFQSSRVVAEIWSRLKAGRQTENCQDPEDQTKETKEEHEEKEKFRSPYVCMYMGMAVSLHSQREKGIPLVERVHVNVH